MIIKLLMDIIYNVFEILTNFIDIPPLPDSIISNISLLLDEMQFACSILSAYVDLSYLFSLFGIVILVDFGISTYRFIMWVLKKIPMLGIE